MDMVTSNPPPLPDTEEPPPTDDAVVPHPLTTTAPTPARLSTRNFALPTSSEHNGRASQIQLCSNQRPHMRAFHCATAGFFAAFFVWFSLSPLLSVVGDALDLTRQQLWISTMCNDASTVVTRLLIFGPLCDVIGARRLLSTVLILVAIPTALVGTVHTWAGLCAIRFAMGLAGSAFVMAQFWMGQMFLRHTIGTANAIVAGWGNLGGGVAQLVMGTGLYPLAKWWGGTPEQAWRGIFVVPALLSLITGIVIVRVSDDAPGGYYHQMRKEGTMDVRPVSMVRLADTQNAWLLAVAYACSFGVEITFNNAGSLYFQDEFGLTVEGAAAVASVFGMTNLFARAVGGILSDRLNRFSGMQGRLRLAAATSLGLGIAGIAFAYCDTLASAVPVMVLFSSMVHATEGAIFGIVPYITPAHAGSVAGIVGTGGNLGGIMFAIGFYFLSYRNAFLIMGVAAVASSVVYAAVHIPGHSRMWTREGAIFESVTTPGNVEMANRGAEDNDDDDNNNPAVDMVNDTSSPPSSSAVPVENNPSGTSPLPAVMEEEEPPV